MTSTRKTSDPATSGAVPGGVRRPSASQRPPISAPNGLGGGEQPDGRARGREGGGAEGRQDGAIGEGEDVHHQRDQDHHAQRRRVRDEPRGLGDAGQRAAPGRPRRLRRRRHAQDEAQRHEVEGAGDRGRGGQARPIGTGRRPAAGRRRGWCCRSWCRARRRGRGPRAGRRRPPCGGASPSRRPRPGRRASPCPIRCQGASQPRLARSCHGAGAEGRAGLQEDQQAAPVEALGQHAGERAEQQHGQGAHHGDGGDGQGGMGGLEGPERGGQHLQPAHGIGDAAEQPEAPVVGRAQQPQRWRFEAGRRPAAPPHSRRRPSNSSGRFHPMAWREGNAGGKCAARSGRGNKSAGE
jgi:hypothetical protein